jgi:hypothetical protein
MAGIRLLHGVYRQRTDGVDASLVDVCHPSRTPAWGIGCRKEGRTSFLKKRSKKLLHIATGNSLNMAARTPDAMSKSFLVLFFKKERSFF